MFGHDDIPWTSNLARALQDRRRLGDAARLRAGDSAARRGRRFAVSANLHGRTMRFAVPA